MVCLFIIPVYTELLIDNSFLLLTEVQKEELVAYFLSKNWPTSLTFLAGRIKVERLGDLLTDSVDQRLYSNYSLIMKLK